MRDKRIYRYTTVMQYFPHQNGHSKKNIIYLSVRIPYNSRHLTSFHTTINTVFADINQYLFAESIPRQFFVLCRRQTYPQEAALIRRLIHIAPTSVTCPEITPYQRHYFHLQATLRHLCKTPRRHSIPRTTLLPNK